MNRVVTGYAGTYAGRRQRAFTKLDFLKTRFIFKSLVLGAFMVFLSLIYIWSRVQIIQSGYDINRLKSDRAALVNENKRLKMELSLFQSPERLQKIAVEKFKMALPDRGRIVEIR